MSWLAAETDSWLIKHMCLRVVMSSYRSCTAADLRPVTLYPIRRSLIRWTLRSGLTYKRVNGSVKPPVGERLSFFSLSASHMRCHKVTPAPSPLSPPPAPLM